MVYSDEFPILLVPTPLGGNQGFYLRKHTDWAYDKEWRAVLPLNGCSITMRPRAISAMILGARANADTVDAVNALQQERLQLGKPLSICIGPARRLAARTSGSREPELSWFLYARAATTVEAPEVRGCGRAVGQRAVDATPRQRPPSCGSHTGT